jgi:hypothetical protein
MLKRVILGIVMALCFTVPSFSQIIKFKATSVAFKEVGYRWSDWQKCNILITFNLGTDKVVIYSQSIQVYKVLTQGQEFVDESGGQQVKYDVIDQDDDLGDLRLRVERNGNSQIYIDFADVSWVYNVVRISE